MEKFAEYGFNKSHSAAYALITYQTAYLKAHYPVEFMAGAALARDGRHRQDLQEHRRVPRPRHRGAAARRQRVRRATSPSSRTKGDPLRPRRRARASARRRSRPSSRRAPTAARSPASSTSASGSRGQLVNRRVIESLVKCGAFDSVERNRGAPPRRARRRDALGGQPRGGARVVADGALRRRRRDGAAAAAGGRPGLEGRGGAARRARGDRLLHHRPPARPLRAGPAQVHQRDHGAIRTRGPELPPGDAEVERASRPPPARPPRRRHPLAQAAQQQEGRSLRDLRPRGQRGRGRGDRLAGHATGSSRPCCTAASRW